MQSRAGSVCVCVLPFSLGLPPIQHHQITSNPVPCVIGSVDKQRLPEEALNTRGMPIEVAWKMRRASGWARLVNHQRMVVVQHIYECRHLSGICVIWVSYMDCPEHISASVPRESALLSSTQLCSP